MAWFFQNNRNREIDRITTEARESALRTIAEQKERHPWFRFYGADYTPITSFCDACNKIRIFCPRHFVPGFQEIEKFGEFSLDRACCGCWFTITGNVRVPCQYFADDEAGARKYFNAVKEALVWVNDNDKLHKYDCRFRSEEARPIFFDEPASSDFSLCVICKPKRLAMRLPALGIPMVPLPPVNRFVLQENVVQCLPDPESYLARLKTDANM